MYACITATLISKKVNMNKIIRGNKLRIKKKSPINTIDQLNPRITFNKACPANILAKSRTERLTTLKVYEINSIGIKRKSNAKGAPDGIKRLKKYATPCLRNIR